MTILFSRFSLSPGIKTGLGLYQSLKNWRESAEKTPLTHWYSCEGLLSPDSALVSQILTTVLPYWASLSDQNKRSLLKSKAERTFFLHKLIFIQLKTPILNWTSKGQYKCCRAGLVVFMMFPLPLLLLNLLLPLSQAACNSCLVRRSSLSSSTSSLCLLGQSLIKNSPQGGGRVDWGSRRRLQQAFHFLWGEYFPFLIWSGLWCQGRNDIHKDRWTSFGWEVLWTTLMCLMDQLLGENDYD